MIYEINAVKGGKYKEGYYTKTVKLGKPQQVFMVLFSR